MKPLTTLLVLAAALLAVFLQAASPWPRAWLGAQPDLLPALMVFASLSTGLTTVLLLAVVGGLGMDVLSANPLGVSILPLFLIGFAIEHFRHLILRDQTYAQWILGLSASAAGPAMTLLLIVSIGGKPIVSMSSLWQWLVMALVGATSTPVFFRLFDRLDRGLSYRPLRETSFRMDREIARGRR